MLPSSPCAHGNQCLHSKQTHPEALICSCAPWTLTLNTLKTLTLQTLTPMTLKTLTLDQPMKPSAVQHLFKSHLTCLLPTHRFSSVAVVHREPSGYWCLNLRVANIRKHQILKPSIRMIMTAVDSITPSNYTFEHLEVSAQAPSKQGPVG